MKPGMFETRARAFIFLLVLYLIGVLFGLGIWKAVELIGAVL